MATKSGWIDVRDKGAKGDGTPPYDTAAIQGAFDDAHNDPLEERRSVYFPPGHYIVDDEIIVYDNIKVSGLGWMSKIQQVTCGKNVFTSMSGCTFEGLHIIGKEPGRTFKGLHIIEEEKVCGICGIYANAAENITISDCFIEKCGSNGILLLNCLDTTILNNCLFANGADKGHECDIAIVSSPSGSRRHLIQGNYCLSSCSEGIDVSTNGFNEDILIKDNICVTLKPDTCIEGGTWEEDSTGGGRRHGIIVSYNDNIVGGPRCIVTGNLCRNTRWTGIYKTGITSGPVIIANNICSRNGLDLQNKTGISGGILINQSGYELVDGNYIIDCQASDGGITITCGGTPPTFPSVVSNNVIQNSRNIGILVGYATALMQIRGNTIINSSNSDIHVEPTPDIKNTAGHVIAGNTLHRTNKNQPAICLLLTRESLPITIRDNEIRCDIRREVEIKEKVVFDYTPQNIRPLPDKNSENNAGIYSKQNPGQVRAYRNHIYGFYYAFNIMGSFDGRQPDEVFENNIIEYCNVGFAVGAAKPGAVVPLVNNVFVSTKTKVDTPPGPFYCVGYVCIREGDRFIVEETNAAPTGDTWIVGDRCHFTAPIAGGSIGAVCVAAKTAGNPPVWKNFGKIDP